MRPASTYTYRGTCVRRVTTQEWGPCWRQNGRHCKGSGRRARSSMQQHAAASESPPPPAIPPPPPPATHLIHPRHTWLDLQPAVSAVSAAAAALGIPVLCSVAIGSSCCRRLPCLQRRQPCAAATTFLRGGGGGGGGGRQRTLSSIPSQWLRCLHLMLQERQQPLHTPPLAHLLAPLSPGFVPL